MNWSSCTESLPSSDLHPAGRATQFSGDSAVVPRWFRGGKVPPAPAHIVCKNSLLARRCCQNGNTTHSRACRDCKIFRIFRQL